jgi:hypothetical protein
MHYWGCTKFYRKDVIESLIRTSTYQILGGTERGEFRHKPLSGPQRILSSPRMPYRARCSALDRYKHRSWAVVRDREEPDGLLTNAISKFTTIKQSEIQCQAGKWQLRGVDGIPVGQCWCSWPSMASLQKVRPIFHTPLIC